MPVVGVIMHNIEAKRIGELTPNISVSNKASASNVTEVSVPGFSDKGLSISFKFSSDYSADNRPVGEIRIDGDIWFVGDGCKEIMKQWKKDKTIPEDPHIEIINTVFRKCVSRAISLAEDVQLPPPVGLPFAQKQKKE